jgi:hypothetical protein
MTKMKPDTALAVLSAYIGVGCSAIFFGLGIYLQESSPSSSWWIYYVAIGVLIVLIPYLFLRKSLK